jgi:hypothetical protein
MSNNMTTHHAATGYSKKQRQCGRKGDSKKIAGEKDKFVDEVCALIQKHLTEVSVEKLQQPVVVFLMERPWSKPTEGVVKVNFGAAFYDISGSGAWVLLRELIREKQGLGRSYWGWIGKLNHSS